jgi:hypothetical protein
MGQTTLTGERLRDLIALRLIVGALGERCAPPWWKTQFLTDVGMRAMVRILPRTALSGALTSISIVVREDHDKRIGDAGRYHLFRLPTAVERALMSALLNDAVIQTQVLAPLQKGKDGLVEALESQANGRPVRTTEGPVLLGKPESLSKMPTLQEMAAFYRDSFAMDRRAVPYFQDTEGRA